MDFVREQTQAMMMMMMRNGFSVKNCSSLLRMECQMGWTGSPNGSCPSSSPRAEPSLRPACLESTAFRADSTQRSNVAHLYVLKTHQDFFSEDMQRNLRTGSQAAQTQWTWKVLLDFNQGTWARAHPSRNVRSDARQASDASLPLFDPASHASPSTPQISPARGSKVSNVVFHLN